MRVSQILVLGVAAAFAFAGCEGQERDRGDREGSGQVAVIGDPGGVAVDVEPDPSQRVYVYDEGYPPGTYLYNDYYYYGGHRYPRDVFVNRYVHENIRQHHFVNADDNRRQGQQIEQRQRADFTNHHGTRQNPAERPSATPAQQAPVRQQESPRQNADRPEFRNPTKEEHRPAIQSENRTPVNEEHRANVQRPENKAGAAREEHKSNAEEQRREESK